MKVAQQTNNKLTLCVCAHNSFRPPSSARTSAAASTHATTVERREGMTESTPPSGAVQRASEMLADSAVHEWTREVEETADRLAREALQQLHAPAATAASSAPPASRASLPVGLFDPALPNHPLPSQPPQRAREAAKLAAVIACLPAPRPAAAPTESASLLSAVDAVLTEAEAVLRREQKANDVEEKQSEQLDRRKQLNERHAAVARVNERVSRQQPRQQQPLDSAAPIPTATKTPATIRALSPPSSQVRSTAMRHSTRQSEEIIRMKKAIELRTQQRRKERDEALKAEMLDKQRRNIIARYEETEGKRREEERKEQEHEVLKTQKEAQARDAVEQRQRQAESARQQHKQQLEDKKRQAAEAIRQQRLLAKQQQQKQLLAQFTQSVQRRTDQRLVQHAWQQWLEAVREARQAKQAKAASVWRYNCTARNFRLWREVVMRAKVQQRRVEEESLRRRKKDRRMQAETHWKLKHTQRSDAMHSSGDCHPSAVRVAHALSARCLVCSLFAAWRWSLQEKSQSSTLIDRQLCLSALRPCADAVCLLSRLFSGYATGGARATATEAEDESAARQGQATLRQPRSASTACSLTSHYRYSLLISLPSSRSRSRQAISHASTRCLCNHDDACRFCSNHVRPTTSLRLALNDGGQRLRAGHAEARGGSSRTQAGGGLEAQREGG